MKSYEALQRAIAGKTVEHAKQLHLSSSLVNKWQEPSTDFNDSGAYNPLDRVETIVDTSLSLGMSHDDATAPIQFLAERFNFIAIPIQQSKIKSEDLSIELLKTIKEFGDLSQEAAEAMKNGSISKNEAGRIDKEAWELIRQVSVFLQTVNSSAR